MYVHNATGTYSCSADSTYAFRTNIASLLYVYRAAKNQKVGAEATSRSLNHVFRETTARWVFFLRKGTHICVVEGSCFAKRAIHHFKPSISLLTIANPVVVSIPSLLGPLPSRCDKLHHQTFYSSSSTVVSTQIFRVVIKN